MATTEIPAVWRTEETRVREALRKARLECDFELRRKPFLRSGFDGDHVLEVQCLVCNCLVPLHDERGQFWSSGKISLQSYVQHALKEHATEDSRQLRFFQTAVPSTKTAGGVVFFEIAVRAWLTVGGKHKKLEWIVERRFREVVALRDALAMPGLELSASTRYGLKRRDELVEKRRAAIDAFLASLATTACEDIRFLKFLGCADLGDVIDNPSLQVQHHREHQHQNASRQQKKRPRRHRLFCCCVATAPPDIQDDVIETPQRPSLRPPCSPTLDRPPSFASRTPSSVCSEPPRASFSPPRNTTQSLV